MTASSDVTQWLSCIVGNVGNMLLKGKKNVWVKMVVSLVDHYLIPSQGTAFENLVPTLPTMQCDITTASSGVTKA